LRESLGSVKRVKTYFKEEYDLVEKFQNGRMTLGTLRSGLQFKKEAFLLDPKVLTNS
jgi:hypothetical protein